MLVPRFDEIEIVGGALEFTVIVIALLTLVNGVGQLSELVMLQVTTSPFDSEAVE